MAFAEAFVDVIRSRNDKNRSDDTYIWYEHQKRYPRWLFAHFEVLPEVIARYPGCPLGYASFFEHTPYNICSASIKNHNYKNNHWYPWSQSYKKVLERFYGSKFLVGCQRSTHVFIVARQCSMLKHMRILNGRDLADFVKERQARQVRGLRQAHGVAPRLAIVQTIDSPVIDTYVRMKRAYGDDILVDVDVHKVPQEQAADKIRELNDDDSVYGIIVQLPLENPAETDVLVNLVAPEKDIDGLRDDSPFDPATPMAIDWLLVGYNIELRGKRVAIVGHGRLVGAPLERMWLRSGYDVTVFDDTSTDMAEQLPEYDVIVTATGVPGLITSSMLKTGATVVDAGTASEQGKIVGDVAADVRARDDLKITPEKGGVGPLTVAALFDNVIRAAQKRAGLL